MPDLIGRSVLEAKAALKAVGIEDVVTEPEDAAPDAVITGHSPLVGKTVFQTDNVVLTTKEK
jgi:beta-lactam-binding protein with PASTA domain